MIYNFFIKRDDVHLYEKNIGWLIFIFFISPIATIPFIDFIFFDKYIKYHILTEKEYRFLSIHFFDDKQFHYFFISNLWSMIASIILIIYIIYNYSNVLKYSLSKIEKFGTIYSLMLLYFIFSVFCFLFIAFPEFTYSKFASGNLSIYPIGSVLMMSFYIFYSTFFSYMMILLFNVFKINSMIK